MSIPGVADGARKRAFRAFVRELQNSSAFANRRVIKTWLLYDGASSIADPQVSEMPCVRLRMMGGPVERLASQGSDGGQIATITTKSSPTVMVELWTAGTDQGDGQNLADMIEDVLFPHAAADRQAIQDRFALVGIFDWQLVQEIAPEDVASFGDSWIYAAGRYQLTLVFSD